jgi:hypothetical protein
MSELNLNEMAESTVEIPLPADKEPGFYHKGYTPEQRKMAQRQSQAKIRSKARGDNAHLTGWIQA